MYSTRTTLTYGFHGCDKSLLNQILLGKETLKPSKNRYDWLSNGIYFWYSSPSRALDYANILKANPKKTKRPIQDPAVLGAVLDLGYCLDLLDYENLKTLRNAYDFFVSPYAGSTLNFPQNSSGGSSEDLLLRELDCSVIQSLHETRLRKSFGDTIRYGGDFGKENYYIQTLILEKRTISRFAFAIQIASRRIFVRWFMMKQLLMSELRALTNFLDQLKNGEQMMGFVQQKEFRPSNDI